MVLSLLIVIAFLIWHISNILPLIRILIIQPHFIPLVLPLGFLKPAQLWCEGSWLVAQGRSRQGLLRSLCPPESPSTLCPPHHPRIAPGVSCIPPVCGALRQQKKAPAPVSMTRMGSFCEMKAVMCSPCFYHQNRKFL